MTKKDYQAIARAIYRLHGSQQENWPTHEVSLMVESLADMCATDNPRFNRALFIEACETGHCKGMSR